MPYSKLMNQVKFSAEHFSPLKKQLISIVSIEKPRLLNVRFFSFESFKEANELATFAFKTLDNKLMTSNPDCVFFNSTLADILLEFKMFFM